MKESTTIGTKHRGSVTEGNKIEGARQPPFGRERAGWDFRTGEMVDERSEGGELLCKGEGRADFSGQRIPLSGLSTG